MTDPYTPETIDVKVAYCTSLDPGFAHKVMAHTVAEMTTGHAGDFDRWLEKHDREVKAQALRDAKAWIKASSDQAALDGDWAKAWNLSTSHALAVLDHRAARLTATAEEPT